MWCMLKGVLEKVLIFLSFQNGLRKKWLEENSLIFIQMVTKLKPNKNKISSVLKIPISIGNSNTFWG